MNLSIELIERISSEYGESFYIMDSKQFERNFEELQQAFRDIYPNFHICYSYKTNYIPKLCKIVNKYGGYAEIVSDMEYGIALKVGVPPNKIIYNGPYKKRDTIEELLLAGGIVNVDSSYELEILKDICNKYQDKTIGVGLRCNFDINDGVLSRFGFDIDGMDFKNAIEMFKQIENLKLRGLHCHFATRNLDFWPARAEKMLTLVQKYFVEPPEYISLGGGLFGKMDESLKAQFNTKVPSYKEYAEAVATKIKDFYKDIDQKNRPKLFIEPGTALVGDVMKFVTKVVNIKDVRGKKIATLAGSIYNINPTLNKKNLPITIYHHPNNTNSQNKYKDLDFGGYTCIESDYLYRGFYGQLAVGDYVVFDNVGSYSVVLKPPFILPNFPIVEYNEDTNSIELIKRQETFDDLFKTFSFD